ncbi:MAG: hypothetical protein AAFQ21_15465, partial [Pseudomonadota bacterium]
KDRTGRPLEARVLIPGPCKSRTNQVKVEGPQAHESDPLRKRSELELYPQTTSSPSARFRGGSESPVWKAPA